MDKSLAFDVALIQLSFHIGVYIHVFSIQMFQYFSQIAPRVCTLVLFTLTVHVWMCTVLSSSLTPLLTCYTAWHQIFEVYDLSSFSRMASICKM